MQVRTISARIEQILNNKKAGVILHVANNSDPLLKPGKPQALFKFPYFINRV